MAPPVPAGCVGYCCKVDLARRPSLLTSRQVKYVSDTFDLKNTKDTFDFVFRLYNFVEVANENDRTLRDPWQNLGMLHSEVKDMKLRVWTTRKRKTEGDDAAGNRPPKKPRTGNGAVESDILSDVAIMEALKCTGYTIPPEVENFESLLPVSVSFP
jgi:hypothetical protein